MQTFDADILTPTTASQLEVCSHEGFKDSYLNLVLGGPT